MNKKIRRTYWMQGFCVALGLFSAANAVLAYAHGLYFFVAFNGALIGAQGYLYFLWADIRWVLRETERYRGLLADHTGSTPPP